MSLPTVVQFGAGNIGRGFMGQLWTEGGYEVVFVDVDEQLVQALNARRGYPIRFVESDGHEERVLGPVRAVNGRDVPAVADALARCAFACTAVGVNVFAHLAPTLAAGVAARAARNPSVPLNVLCCENQAGAGALLRAAVASALPPEEPVHSYFAGRVAFVDASVGRMVPAQTSALRAEDPLLVAAEPYHDLPIDGSAWLGPLPAIPGLHPKNNFAGYVARKLFTHNGGHALLAYLGYLRGHATIWQAAEDAALIRALRGAWDETGAALVAAWGFDPAEQRRHEDDLLRRFRNRALGDTIERVARDPLRKLRPDDRLVGGALLCLERGITPVHVCRGIAAALRYDAPDDPTAGRVRGEVAGGGVRGALQTLCGLAEDSPLAALVASAYEDLENQTPCP